MPMIRESIIVHLNSGKGLMLKIFLLILLCGIVCSQNFSFVQLSDIHIGYNDRVIPYYKKTVGKINSLIEEYDIQFALATGDLSHHSSQQELDIAANITVELKIPFFPILGNHDVLKNHGKTLHGDYRFMKKFETILLNSSNIKHYTGNKKIYYRNETDCYEYLQNYQLEFFDGKVVFLMTDWNDRDSRPLMANLHDYKNGTFPWFEMRLNELSRDPRVKLLVMVQHHPFMNPLHIPLNWFSKNMRQKVQRVIEVSKISSDVFWGDIAGHDHMFWFFKEVFRGLHYKEYMDSATKKKASFTIFKIENWKMKTALQYCIACGKGTPTIIDIH